MLSDDVAILGIGCRRHVYVAFNCSFEDLMLEVGCSSVRWLYAPSGRCPSQDRKEHQPISRCASSDLLFSYVRTSGSLHLVNGGN